MVDKNELIENNMHVVDEVINNIKFPRFLTTDEINELKSVGYLALVEAINSFSENFSVPIDFWARNKIKWSIYDFLREERDKEGIPATEKEDIEIECKIDLKKAIKSLSEFDQKILEDIFIYGFSQEEIAKRYNISRQTINKMYGNILEKLKEYYDSQNNENKKSKR